MLIKYTEGPPAVTMGAAGPLKKGEAKEVADDLAAQLLKKKTIVFTESDPSEKSDPSDALTEESTEEV